MLLAVTFNQAKFKYYSRLLLYNNTNQYSYNSHAVRKLEF